MSIEDKVLKLNDPALTQAFNEYKKCIAQVKSPALGIYGQKSTLTFCGGRGAGGGASSSAQPWSSFSSKSP